MKVIVPPIKSQGIKTKLVPWINEVILSSGIDLSGNWIEPFFGTGVVGFNTVVEGSRIIGDSNPYIINFYKSVQSGEITPETVRFYLETEGESLSQIGYDHYTQIKNRFNQEHSPLDFLFLSRAGFNGMMRFNRKGEWNIPFCKKSNRFAPAYITKICNQVSAVSACFHRYSWDIEHSDFLVTLSKAKKGDIIYCDPPYYGRDTDYYNGWSEMDEKLLFDKLSQIPAYFMLSTWHHTEFRHNEMIDKYWGQFNVRTREHFYHNGGHMENRHPVVEALICNF